LDSALKTLTAIDKVYCESDHYGKRKLIGSIYPEKFTFEELRVRTAKKGDVFEFIYLINSALSSNKKGTNGNFYHLSQRVNPIGFEPLF
jgi:site-specific DNA recombinase